MATNVKGETNGGGKIDLRRADLLPRRTRNSNVSKSGLPRRRRHRRILAGLWLWRFLDSRFRSGERGKRSASLISEAELCFADSDGRSSIANESHPAGAAGLAFNNLRSRAAGLELSIAPLHECNHGKGKVYAC